MKNPSKKRRRYYYAHFNSGPLANVLNIFTFMISILLFLSYFVQLYNDADIEVCLYEFLMLFRFIEWQFRF